MKIHEYQAKQILARYNVRIPRGEVAKTKEEARQIAERLGEKPRRRAISSEVSDPSNEWLARPP